MSRRISFTLLALMILGLSVFGVVRFIQTVTSDHDGWDLFAPIETTTAPLIVEPPNLLTPNERDAISRIVREARTFGIPWSVQVTRPTGNGLDATVQEMADEQYDQRPVESAEGAADGLLMLVIIPPEDHTQTQAAFATGPNFYPRGGITPERLDTIVTDQMRPAIEENRIADALIEGATWLEWTHLFQPTPNDPATNLEQGLQELLEPFAAVGLAGLALLILVSTCAVVGLTRRGTGTAPDPGWLDGMLAAAIVRGRVDRPVLAGAVLDATDRGVLMVTDGDLLHTGSTPVSLNREAVMVKELQAAQAGGGGAKMPVFLRSLASRSEMARSIEDELALAGAFHPRSPILTWALRALAAAGLTLGLAGLVVSVLGEARYALAAAVMLTALSLPVLIWNERRSWTTSAGKRAVATWRDHHHAPDNRERLLYETIVNMEPISATRSHNGPLQVEGWRLLPDVH
jgi:uncharacterized membrane protein YgcG